MTVISRRTKRWDHSGVALGGIGAGKIEFCPSGRFSNVMTQNNWDAPITASAPVQKPVYDPEGIPGAFLAAWVEGAGAVALKEHARAGFRAMKPGQIRYEGMFPRAVAGYPAMNGVEISVEAFSSLALDSDGKDRYKDSSLPAAVFVFRLKNTTRGRRRASVLMSWQNLVGIGGYVEGLVTDTRKQKIDAGESADASWLEFGAIWPRINPRVDGRYVLMTPRRAADVAQPPSAAKKRKSHPRAGVPHVESFVYDHTNGIPTENADCLAHEFHATGTVPKPGKAMPAVWWRKPSGALNVRLTLAAGASAEVPFVLAWHFPNLVATTKPDVNYGHRYENWFGSARETAEYVLRERRRLYASTRSWQQALEKSNLPAWLVEKLANDLFPLYGNTWYTRDGRHTVNESPTDMSGCHGTIDQRAAASAAEDMCFPGLSKSELSLFAEQQIGPAHPERVGRHWDMKTGRFGRRLDRLGAVRHDTGWDDIEGGLFGSPLWQTLHWPDLTSVFVLEVYRAAAWSGDRAFAKRMWPHVKRALDFQMRLDQNGDGVADLWGHGSNTYDSQDLHYYGASAFIASLFLAANLAAEQLAKTLGDAKFAAVCRRRFAKARKVYEKTLWNEARGHFNSWVDTNFRAWKGTEREHPLKSDSSMIAQVAGQWFANHLGLPDIADRTKLAKALASIYAMNVKPVKYCPAIDMNHDGKHNYSWIQYAETYYAANAIHEGRADEGLDAVHRIWLAQYTHDGSPWDAPLKYAGKDNGDFGWGRWYMTNPATWSLLVAITGVGVDLLRGMLTMSPNIPKAIGGGRTLRRVPVFFPKFHATVDAAVAKSKRRIALRITKLIGGKPVAFGKLRVADTGRAPVVKLNGKLLRVRSAAKTGRFLELDVKVRFAKSGDRLEISL